MSIVKYHLLFMFLLFNLAFGDKANCNDKELNNRLTLSIFAGSSFPALTSGFLEQYNEQLGGIKMEFQTYWGFGGAINYQIDEKFRVSLNSEYIANTLQDNFIQEITGYKGLWRTFSEDINLSTIPITLSLYYYQFFEKYKSYGGLGLGVSYSAFKWKENVISPLQNDTRIGGTIYNSIDFYPTIRAELGLDLDWDRDHPNVFMKSVSLSANFYYIIRYPRVFANLENQISPFPEEMKGNHGIVPFYIGLNLGLTFNIEKYVMNP